MGAMMIAFISGVGWHEVVIVFGLAVLIFGSKRLSSLGRGIGQAVYEFRKASRTSPAKVAEVQTTCAEARR